MKNPLDPSMAAIEQAIWFDPGQRGIHSLCLPGELARAAESLLQAEQVVIVTGFFVVDQQTYETDGPPGAIALGNALGQLDIDVEYLTDAAGDDLFDSAGLEPVSATLLGRFLSGDPTHLVSIERLGRAADGKYYSKRGRDLSHVTEPLDNHFLNASLRDITTIGMGDGGNEIGMGKVHDNVVSHIPHGETIASTIETDHLIVAGTSNWGAWGLVAALSIIANRNLLPTKDGAIQHLQRLIDAGACDGVTGQRELSVDGLKTEVYLQPLDELHRIVNAAIKSSR